MTKSAAGTARSPGRNVRAKSGLNKANLDQGWGMLLSTLDAKMAARAGKRSKAPPQFTSRKRPERGRADKASRETQADFQCVRRGDSNSGGVVGAQNMLKAGEAALNTPAGDKLPKAGR